MKTKFFKYTAIIIVVALCIAAVVMADSWNTFRQNAPRTGSTNPASGVLGSSRPYPIWIFPAYTGITVDNVDPEFSTTGSWSTLTGGSSYGDDCKYTSTGSTSTSTAVWNLTVPALTPGKPSSADNYNVYVFFPTYDSTVEDNAHSTDATYEVKIGIRVIGSYSIDQTEGGEWIKIAGPIYVNDGETVTVTLSNKTSVHSIPTTVVVADAAGLARDTGAVRTSPIASDEHSILVTSRIETKILPEVPGQDAERTVGTVYGVGTDTDSGIPDTPGFLPDDRGMMAWRFPANPNNWIEKGMSSTPAITRINGEEAAIVPARDGTIYVMETMPYALPGENRVIWRGPGYIQDNPTQTTGSWSVANHPGYQGEEGYLHASANSGTTATWEQKIKTIGKYRIYAWIPPSTSAERYTNLATYKVEVVGTKVYDGITISQSNGGRWISLGGVYETEAANTNVKVTLTKGADYFLAADAIKIVPADIGEFDVSSPVVDSGDPTIFYIGANSAFGTKIVGRLYAFKIGQPDPVWVYPDPNYSPAPAVPYDPTNPKFPAPNGLGLIFSSPALDGGKLYFGSSDGHVYAINASNGNLDWVYPSTTDTMKLHAVSVTPAVKGDKVYVAAVAEDSASLTGESGVILALNKSGTLVDQYTYIYNYGGDPINMMGGFMYSSPLLMNIPSQTNPALAIGSTDGRMYCLDAETLTPLSSIPSVTLNSDTNIVFPYLWDNIYSSPAGTEVNTYETREYFEDTTGTVTQGTNVPLAFVGTEGWRLYAIDLSEGAWDWWYGLLGSVTSSPAIRNGRVYTGDGAGYTWAFSTRDDSGGGGGFKEAWNPNAGDIPKTESSDKDGDGSQAKPEIDVFRLDEFSPIVDKATISDPLDGDLHKINLQTKGGSNFVGDKYIYEWGETINIIVWNLIDKESTVTVNIDYNDPGDSSNGRDAATLVTRGTFTLSGGGEPIHFAKFTYKIDGGMSGNGRRGRVSAPGQFITITCRENPKQSPSGGKHAAGNSFVPINPEEADPQLRLPQRFTINNPLALAHIDTGTYIGVTNAGFTTTRDDPFAGMNGNGTKIPIVSPKDPYNLAQKQLVAHGTASNPAAIVVSDRSLMGRYGLTISRFRIDRQDMVWQGGPAQAVNPMSWEMQPPVAGWNLPNTSPDYPDISFKQVSSLMNGSRLDPSRDPVTLMGTAAGTDVTPWKAGQNGVWLSVNVPRFQPANSNLNYGYAGKIYAYIDGNSNGRLDRPGELGTDSWYAQRSSGVRSEPFRELNFQTFVPVDRRVHIVEQLLDVGEVPHGFGLTPSSGGVSRFNSPALDAGSPVPSGFGKWFKTFNAYNEGNTNLLNIGFAKGNLTSDSTQVALIAGNDNIVSSLDSIYMADAKWGGQRTFHKARVGEDASQLYVPDSRSETGPPALSVAVPIGQPVGTYSGLVQLAEAGVPVSNPITVKVTATEARLTDTTSADSSSVGTIPQLDIRPDTEGMIGDNSPAAYRDYKTRNLHVIWSSSRYAEDILGGITFQPSSVDPWYLYMSTLKYNSSGNSRGWRFFDNNRWWEPTRSTTGGPSTFPSQGVLSSVFPASPNGAAGVVDPATVKFTSPSITVDDPSGRAWLFYTAQAYKNQSNNNWKPTGTFAKNLESRIYYKEITGGTLTQFASNPVTVDYTMPKYGIKGIATRNVNSNQSDPPWLWSFWYGGNNNKWRLYYSVNADADNPATWSNPAQLDVPSGLTSIAEPSPVWRWYKDANGNNINRMDVVYSGFSAFYKNSDIYMSRYQPSTTPSSRSLRIQTLPEVKDQKLERDPEKGIYFSRHADWKCGNTPWTSGDFHVYVNYPNGTVHEVTKYDSGDPVPIKDSATGAIAYTDHVFPASGGTTLRELYRSVVVDPVSGTVKFMRSPGANAWVTATYTPKAYRLTTDDASDVSPFALFDDDPNPLYDERKLDNPFYEPPSGSDTPRIDRLWLFWRRSDVNNKPGAGIHYKTFRYIVQLDKQVRLDEHGKPDVTGIRYASGGGIITPVEIDWTTNRLFFMAEEDGREIEISYRDRNGDTITQNKNNSLNYTVRMEEEFNSGTGSLTSVTVNEGQISAFKDPDPGDPSGGRIWLFWTSTRSGNTDIYYETISPVFRGRPLP